MKATLGLEIFGENHHAFHDLYRRIMNDGVPGLGDAMIGFLHYEVWIAEIISTDPKYIYARHFMHGKKDYSRSNSKGSRGVFLWYILESGHLYEVQAQTSWKHLDRYFCMVNTEGEIIRQTKEEVDAWLNNHGSAI